MTYGILGFTMNVKEIKKRDEEIELRSRKKVFFLIGEANPAISGDII